MSQNDCYIYMYYTLLLNIVNMNNIKELVYLKIFLIFANT